MDARALGSRAFGEQDLFQFLQATEILTQIGQKSVGGNAVTLAGDPTEFFLAVAKIAGVRRGGSVVHLVKGALPPQENVQCVCAINHPAEDFQIAQSAAWSGEALVVSADSIPVGSCQSKRIAFILQQGIVRIVRTDPHANLVKLVQVDSPGNGIEQQVFRRLVVSLLDGLHLHLGAEMTACDIGEGVRMTGEDVDGASNEVRTCQARAICR